MKIADDTPGEITQLRCRAEERLSTTEAEALPPRPVEVPQSLLHELQVHQQFRERRGVQG